MKGRTHAMKQIPILLLLITTTSPTYALADAFPVPSPRSKQEWHDQYKRHEHWREEQRRRDEEYRHHCQHHSGECWR